MGLFSHLIKNKRISPNISFEFFANNILFLTKSLLSVLEISYLVEFSENWEILLSRAP